MNQTLAIVGYMAAILAFAVVGYLFVKRMSWDGELNKWAHPFRQFQRYWREPGAK